MPQESCDNSLALEVPAGPGRAAPPEGSAGALPADIIIIIIIISSSMVVAIAITIDILLVH